MTPAIIAPPTAPPSVLVGMLDEGGESGGLTDVGRLKPDVTGDEEAGMTAAGDEVTTSDEIERMVVGDGVETTILGGAAAVEGSIVAMGEHDTLTSSYFIK